MRKKLIGVIGAGDASPREAQWAYDVGRLIGEAGYPLVSGGMLGVMEAASRGCSEAGGTTLGILRVGEADGGNDYLTFAIATGMHDARNAIITNSAEVFIAIGGSYGTLSEIAYALKRKKPVITLGSWKLDESRMGDETFIVADDPAQAVELALTHLQ